MEQNIFTAPRQAFCWVDENNVIIVSKNAGNTIGHCELVNTVSFLSVEDLAFMFKIFKKFCLDFCFRIIKSTRE